MIYRSQGPDAAIDSSLVHCENDGDKVIQIGTTPLHSTDKFSRSIFGSEVALIALKATKIFATTGGDGHEG